MRALRLIADQKHGPEAARALIKHVVPRRAALGIGAGTVVAGYWPIATEIDVRPLLARLIERGALAALPVITRPGGVLGFRAWEPADDLDEGPHGTWQPRASRPAVHPAVILVPTLAFDPAGHRLGQGGGYYDRTLAALRRDRPVTAPVTAIGVAYALQRRDRLLHDDHDQDLDWILTEAGLLEVQR